MSYIITWSYRGSAFGEGYSGAGFGSFEEHEQAEDYIDSRRDEHKAADEFHYRLYVGDLVREGE